MYKEYDVVKAVKRIDNVPLGSMGAILMVHFNKSSENMYEVEFLDGLEESLGVFTVSEKDIELIESA